MATPLDLQEQEQLESLKAFWKQYGNLVTWTLIIALGAIAAFNGWNYWKREQATKAASMFEELERAGQAGDAEKAGRVFADMKERFPRTAYTEQGGLLAAKVQAAKGQADAAKASLAWVAEHAVEGEIGTIARLRLAALQADGKQYDEAMKTLDAAKAEGFEALVADRRGDILHAQGRFAEARAAWEGAYKSMGEKVDYRRLIEAKIGALGAPLPAAAAAVQAASAAAPGASK